MVRCEGPVSVSGLAKPLGVSLAAVVQHLPSEEPLPDVDP
jgi:hypothetical protein